MGKYSIENLLRFTDRGSSNLATSLLDEIVSRDEVDQLSALYRLSNFKKGGSLIERYLLEGQKELENIATGEIKQYMYNNGAGEEMNMGSGKETVVNVGNGVKESSRRTVCWKLDQRGMLGESLLHILVICNTDIHTYIAIYLLDMYPALAHDIVEGEEYYGASAMHFAIAYENSKLVKKLVEVGANILQRANGKFFLPVDQQWPIPRPKTNFEGLSYFGEYPLAWAACCDDESSYNLLLRHGADPNMQDTYGNSILHVLVIRDKLKMYGYALRHPVRPATDRLCNKFGLTPLTLACKLGRNTIFREMLEFSSLEFWRYSNITCSGYPLNALDSLQPNGRANLNSALMIILKGNSTEHLDMLEGGVIQRLLEEKWKTFAQRYFYRRLFMMLFHLLNLSIAVFMRPTTREPLFGRTDAVSIVRYGAEIATCLGCIGFGIIQQVQEILAQGLSGFLVCLTTSPTKSTFVLSCLLILSCIPCRVLEDRETEDILLTMAIPGSWFYLIFFAGAVRLTGPFVTMIYSMLVGDMFRFSIIYMIFLFGFTQAFYFLFKQPPPERTDTKKRFGSYPMTWMSLFHMTLGSYEYEEFRETYYQKLTQLVFAMFMVFMPILLLNMLIAMMGNTYCEVITQSEKEWVKQWANIIVALERAIHHTAAKEFIQTYSIKMPSTDKDTEVRGVIVIKTKLKSKAKEKKQALSLWKRVGKRTVQELRKVGGTAVEVRRRYNLFRSKQPTARLRMGKVVQEWNPAPVIPATIISAPVAKPEKAAVGLDAGFNVLLSQVASASGIDIEKPLELDGVPIEKDKTNVGNAETKETINVQDNKSQEGSNAYINLAFENNEVGIVSSEQNLHSTNQVTHHPTATQQNMFQSNTTQGMPQLNPTAQGLLQSNPTAQGMLQSNPTTQGVLQSNLTAQGMQLSYPLNQQNNAERGSLQIYPNAQEMIQSNPATHGMPQSNPATQGMAQSNLAIQGMLQSNTASYGVIQSNSTTQGILQPNQTSHGILQSSSTPQGILQPNPTTYGMLQSNTNTQRMLQSNTNTQGMLQPNTNMFMSNPNAQGVQHSNSPSQDILPNQNEGQNTSFNDSNLKSELVKWEEPSGNFLDDISSAKNQPEQLQPVKMNDDKGISVSIQTRIISTRITKARIRRRKDSVYPLRNEYSDSTSEKETKRGFLLHKKDNNPAVSNFKGASKYKKRRKRNQISFQEKISVDNGPYSIPVPLENDQNKQN